MKLYNLEFSKDELCEVIEGLDKRYQLMGSIDDLDPEIDQDLIESISVIENLLQRLWFVYSGSRIGYGEYKGDGSRES